MKLPQGLLAKLKAFGKAAPAPVAVAPQVVKKPGFFRPRNLALGLGGLAA